MNTYTESRTEAAAKEAEGEDREMLLNALLWVMAELAGLMKKEETTIDSTTEFRRTRMRRDQHEEKDSKRVQRRQLIMVQVSIILLRLLLPHEVTVPKKLLGYFWEGGEPTKVPISIRLHNFSYCNSNHSSSARPQLPRRRVGVRTIMFTVARLYLPQFEAIKMLNLSSD